MGESIEPILRSEAYSADYAELIRQRTAKREALGQQVDEALAALGDTPEKIAAGLAAAGIKAVPCDADRCAISQYVVKTVGDVVSASTDRWTVQVDGKGVWQDVPLTQAQQDFIQAFDNQAYPDLIDHKEYDAYQIGAGW